MFPVESGARPRTREASPTEHKKWVQVFKACDEDNKGYLSREDFKVAVVMLFGYKPSQGLHPAVLRTYSWLCAPKCFRQCRWEDTGPGMEPRSATCMVETNSVMSSVTPGTPGIPLQEFLNIVRKKKDAQIFRNEIRHIFTAFDRHYRGYLTLEDFQKAFGLVAPKLPERLVLEVFREVDQDSDGHVSFKDFEYALNYGQNEAE